MSPDPAIILVIEDEKPIRRFLRISLADSDYRVIEAETGKDALMTLRSQPPDLVILDLGLPDMDGLEIIDEIRSWSQLPIIILSARDQEKDKIDALDRGADDYLTKPFSVGELLARVRVAMRHRIRDHSGQSGVEAVFESGDLRIDRAARIVTVANQEVHLTPIEYRLLETLIANAGKVLTHRFLLKEVWGPGHADESHHLRVHMANLRHKIESEAASPQFILTEPGVGYRFVADRIEKQDVTRSKEDLA